jgi:hypothetical protein
MQDSVSLYPGPESYLFLSLFLSLFLCSVRSIACRLSAILVNCRPISMMLIRSSSHISVCMLDQDRSPILLAMLSSCSCNGITPFHTTIIAGYACVSMLMFGNGSGGKECRFAHCCSMRVCSALLAVAQPTHRNPPAVSSHCSVMLGSSHWAHTSGIPTSSVIHR